jgi:hypothetical protein
MFNIDRYIYKLIDNVILLMYNVGKIKNLEDKLLSLDDNNYNEIKKVNNKIDKICDKNFKINNKILYYKLLIVCETDNIDIYEQINKIQAYINNYNIKYTNIIKILFENNDNYDLFFNRLINNLFIIVKYDKLYIIYTK